MINLKEKKLLVKMNAALGQPSDPALLAEIATEENGSTVIPLYLYIR